MKNANENFIEVSQGLDREVEWFRFFADLDRDLFLFPTVDLCIKKIILLVRINHPPPAFPYFD